MDIKGRRALVTGGGSGIGRAIVTALVAEGAAEVIVVDYDAMRVNEVVRALGPDVRGAVLDVGDPVALERLFDDAAAGPLDIVCNNAGIITGVPGFPACDPRRIQQVVAINLVAVMQGSLFAIGNMIRNGRHGTIVNTASASALNPSEHDPVYAATKAGVVHFTSSMTAMARDHGIRVNAVSPSMTQTPFLEQTANGAVAPWLADRLAKVILITPEEVAEAVLALIRDDDCICQNVVITNRPVAALDAASADGTNAMTFKGYRR